MAVDPGAGHTTNAFARAAQDFHELAALIPQLMAAQVDALTGQLEEEGGDALKQATPVVTGALQQSTRAVLVRSGNRWVVAFEQPATNRQGQEYAPYVIIGHKTRNPEIQVPPNPYNLQALENAQDTINRLLASTGRAIGAEIMDFVRTRGHQG